MKTITHLYPKIISVENLLVAWEEFIQGKKQRVDVQLFALNLLSNILLLHSDLANFTYKHAGYQRFSINDPKQREIHKATVRDRLLHHAIYRVLYPIFNQGFIYDSYSCRTGKGSHRAVDRLESFIRKVSQNYTSPCFVLKCDIKKFFDSMDHQVLLEIIERKIKDPDLIQLIKEIIESFGSAQSLIQLSLFEIERERERERE